MAFPIFLTEDAALDLSEIQDHITVHDGSEKAEFVMYCI